MASSALRNRVASKGVRVVTIKPGFVDTDMTRGKEGLFWVISADRAAEIILAKARRGVATVHSRFNRQNLVRFDLCDQTKANLGQGLNLDRVKTSAVHRGRHL